MTVLQIILQIWQSIPLRVGLSLNWFLKNFSIGFPCQSSFRLSFFFGGGGGGGGGGWGC